jgi:acyl carrier protein|tara:strand:- start:2001 stop:2210 length:210 start_codon:yes stop_codon:yes gene_type:complete
MDKVLRNVEKALNIKKKLNINVKLADLSEWDSMGALSIIGLADSKYKKTITGDDLSSCVTVKDIIELFS